MNSQPNQQPVSSPQCQWFSTVLGQYLQQEEQILYDQAVVDLFGFNALQMGCLQMDLLRNSRIAHRYRSSDCIDSQNIDLQCSDDFLPFAETSLDLLLLPHRLEFSERPHQTLREAARVMMPEGHLLISGFNPFSLWGLAAGFKNILSGKSILSGRCCVKTFPWNGKFIGLTRLKDWLTLLGFEIVSVQTCCHIPPFEQEMWQRRFGFMKKLGSRWLPAMGGVYFVVAKKHVACMTPLKPNWKATSLQSSLVARPTQRKRAAKPHNKSHCEQ
jgi:SAM-dependent methyltransferase